MINYIIYDIATGEIKRNGTSPDDDSSYEVLVGEGQQSMIGVGDYFTHWVNNGRIQSYTGEQQARKSIQQPYYIVWSNQTFDWVDTRSPDELEQIAINAAIILRNSLLLDSDWTQLSDVPLTNKSEWATYRQSLRDITDQPGFPHNIVWPVSP